MGRSKCEWWQIMKQEYKYWTTTMETAEEYKYASFATKTASEYKYWITTETAERNTSKQFSAKETALQNVYKDSLLLLLLLLFLFFWNRVDTKKRSWGSRMKVFQGCIDSGLEGYLRWKLFNNSLACSSSITSNHSESLSVSLYPSHITL